METVVNLTRTTTRTDSHRHAVMELITRELYPEENYPAKNFPNIHLLLFDHFIEVIKPQKETWGLYTRGENSPRIKEIARDILNFRGLLENHPRMVVLIYRRYIEKFIVYKHTNPFDREDIF